MLNYFPVYEFAGGEAVEADAAEPAVKLAEGSILATFGSVEAAENMINAFMNRLHEALKGEVDNMQTKLNNLELPTPKAKKTSKCIFSRDYSR